MTKNPNNREIWNRFYELIASGLSDEEAHEVIDQEWDEKWAPPNEKRIAREKANVTWKMSSK